MCLPWLRVMTSCFQWRRLRHWKHDVIITLYKDETDRTCAYFTLRCSAFNSEFVAFIFSDYFNANTSRCDLRCSLNPVPAMSSAIYTAWWRLIYIFMNTCAHAQSARAVGFEEFRGRERRASPSGVSGGWMRKRAGDGRSLRADGHFSRCPVTSD